MHVLNKGKASSSGVLSTCLLIVTGSVGPVGGNVSAVGYTAPEETTGNGHVPKQFQQHVYRCNLLYISILICIK